MKDCGLRNTVGVWGVFEESLILQPSGKCLKKAWFSSQYLVSVFCWSAIPISCYIFNVFCFYYVTIQLWPLANNIAATLSKL